MRTVIVIPAYNESKYIGRFLEKLLIAYPKDKIVVVDDGSRDKTVSIARSMGVHVLSHLLNLGKGAALRTGCDYAFKTLSADSVIIMDGDDQHEVKDIKLFEKELKKGAPVVLGVRTLDAKMPVFKLLSNKFFSIVFNILIGGYLADIPSGFKAFTKKAYKQIAWHSNGYEVEMEIAVRVLRSKISRVEVPISTIYHDKDYGFSFKDAFFVICKLPLWIFFK